MDKRLQVVLGIVTAISAGLLGVWYVQGTAMRDDFVQSLRSNDVASPHRDLLNKNWTVEELATAEVIKVPGGTGRERAIDRAIHDRGRIVISAQQFSYQGTVNDRATGIIHVFGFRRAAPERWAWVAIHPSSMQLQIQRRMQQVEAMQRSQDVRTPGASGSARPR